MTKEHESKSVEEYFEKVRNGEVEILISKKKREELSSLRGEIDQIWLRYFFREFSRLVNSAPSILVRRDELEFLIPEVVSILSERRLKVGPADPVATARAKEAGDATVIASAEIGANIAFLAYKMKIGELGSGEVPG